MLTLKLGYLVASLNKFRLLVVILLSLAFATEVFAQAALKNTLNWRTASEVNNFGFDVYRSSEMGGPYKRLTPQPILGQDTTDLLTRYQFVDDSINAEMEYFYYVESISLDGERKRFTPVIRAKPKFEKRKSAADDVELE